MSEATDLQTAIRTLTSVVGRLESSIDQLRADLVRKDVYDSDQRARDASLVVLADDIADLKADAKGAAFKRAADRRLLMSAFVLPAMLIVIQLVIAARLA